MNALFAAPIGALLIFALRVVDVTMGTFRMILMVRGYRALAAGLSFIEIMIWVLAAGHALQHLTSWLHVTGYAAGFATGTYVGIGLENRFALGLVVIKVFCREQDDRETVAETVGGTRVSSASAKPHSRLAKGLRTAFVPPSTNRYPSCPSEYG